MAILVLFQIHSFEAFQLHIHNYCIQFSASANSFKFSAEELLTKFPLVPNFHVNFQERNSVSNELHVRSKSHR